jgi:hypothetical protein
LQSILRGIISPSQGAFVKGRSIHDNISLVQELIQHIDGGHRGGNVIVSLDMIKAFDRISWKSIFLVLTKFGFSNSFIDLLRGCIEGNPTSVLINGTSTEFFYPSRGLRQGDPISPSIFILVEELLCRALTSLQNEADFVPFKAMSRFWKISHLLFADDTILFLNGRNSMISKFMGILRSYQNFTGQCINYSKSKFYVSNRTSARRAQQIKQQLGCERGYWPFKYLGAPIYKGRPKIRYFNHIIEAVHKKLDGWKGKLLSKAGRMTLIKSVLTSMPIHCLSSQHIPVGVLYRIERIMANFLWAGSNQYHLHWISWGEITLPITEGGLGIRRLKDILVVFKLKRLWRFIKRRGIWAEAIHAIYGDINNMRNNFKDSNTWRDLGSTWESHSDLFDLENLKWIPDPDEFTVTSAWEAIRSRGRRNLSNAYFWNNEIPPKISVFLWQARHAALGLDEDRMNRGIHLASICPLCSDASETLEHILCSCKLINQVGKWARNLINTTVDWSTWFCTQLITPNRNKEDKFYQFLAAIICWNTWKLRCEAIFQQTKPAAELVIQQCTKEIWDYHHNFKIPGAAAQRFFRLNGYNVHVT